MPLPRPRRSPDADIPLRHLTPRPAVGGPSDLRDAAVDEQLGAVHEATVVGGEEHDGLRDLVGMAEAAERDLAGGPGQDLARVLAVATDGCGNIVVGGEFDASATFGALPADSGANPQSTHGFVLRP